MVIFSSVIILALGLFLFARGPRPRLDISDIETSFPKNIPLEDLDFQLDVNEKKYEVIDGTEAKIEWFKIQSKNGTYASFISMDSQRADKKFLLRYQLLLKNFERTQYIQG